MPDKTITGRVIRGLRLGKKLGFPTANLDRRNYGRRTPVFRFGVYGGTVQIFGAKKIYRAAIIIGPLDKRGLPKIEAHLFDFLGNLYGKRLAISPKRFIRPFQIYASKEALVRQIKRDISRIKKLKL